ncbi:MAG: RnfABCDGE type electron transport complex subunit G [Bacteroidales bacterium]|nr:RnfABCDGE type electron transport complex subunit G [Bacteroidales bacterium]
MAKESSLKNMLLCLFGVTLGVSALLGGVYILTYESIELAKKNEVNAAIAAVVPAFDNDPSVEIIEKVVDGKKVKIYPALHGGEPVGYAIEASTTQGFSGLIVLIIGFLPDGTIHNSAVVSHAETPGLGDKIEQKKANWSLQFNGKHPDNFKLSVRKDGGDVDAITASTITSRAFCDAVELAYKAFLTVTQQ